MKTTIWRERATRQPVTVCERRRTVSRGSRVRISDLVRMVQRDYQRLLETCRHEEGTYLHVQFADEQAGIREDSVERRCRTCRRAV